MSYKVDLRGYMAECDANYFRLMKLFPEMTREAAERRLGLSHDSDHELHMMVRENTRYTTLIELSQVACAGNDNPWFRLPVMLLRLYHDARVAEVVSCDGIRHLRPSYGYPNQQMHHRDEKAQWNRFLGEWLSHCLARGYYPEPLFGEAP
ncbi:MAG: DUF1249 domain-containing protein [Porticoccaceae bacterium]